MGLAGATDCVKLAFTRVDGGLLDSSLGVSFGGVVTTVGVFRLSLDILFFDRMVALRSSMGVLGTS